MPTCTVLRSPLRTLLRAALRTSFAALSLAGAAHAAPTPPQAPAAAPSGPAAAAALADPAAPLALPPTGAGPQAAPSTPADPAAQAAPIALPSVPPVAAPAPERWAAAFEAFAREDAERTPAPGGVVFVGSSSIRLWTDLRQQFAGWPVIQRGFGGSQMHDCARNVARLVTPYQARLVIVYAGDNDLEAGRTPQQVADDFQAFVDAARRAQPGLAIAFISIKPSPARARLIGRVKEANRLIRDYAQRTEGLRFIDVYSRMVDGEGRPRAELFTPDALHMNASGYALWKAAIEQSVSAASPLAAAPAPAGR